MSLIAWSSPALIALHGFVPLLCAVDDVGIGVGADDTVVTTVSTSNQLRTCRSVHRNVLSKPGAEATAGEEPELEQEQEQEQSRSRNG